MTQVDEILNIEQAADLLQIHWRTLYRRVKSGQVPAVKIGRALRFSRQEILALFTPEPVVDVLDESRNAEPPELLQLRGARYCPYCGEQDIIEIAVKRLRDLRAVAYSCPACEHEYWVHEEVAP